jgi:hypothetical protein
VKKRQLIRVFSDNFEGHLFTVEAFEILKTQLGNGNSEFFESKTVTEDEVEPYETIYDVGDLTMLGYHDDGLTPQNDDVLLDYMAEGETDFDPYTEDDEEDDWT